MKIHSMDKEQAKRTATANYLFSLINTEDSMNFADELKLLGSNVPELLAVGKENKHKVYEQDFIPCDSPVCRYCSNYHSHGHDGEAMLACSRCSNFNQFIGIEAYRVV